MKPFAAFGNVLMCNFLNKGEVYNADIGENIQCTVFWAKGYYKNKNLSTNEKFRDFPTGTFLRPEDFIPGTFEHTAAEESHVFCYDARLNEGKTPPIGTFILLSGQEQILPKNTKLFLCSGTLTIGEKTLLEPAQISISTADTTVYAETDCYGLFFA